VIEVSSDCTLFDQGDAVYYAGSISRPLGTNCEFHLVDERLVGRKPKSLSFEEAAAMPLTTITAWEVLNDRLCLYQDFTRRKTGNNNRQPSILKVFIGGAGGGWP
jgi:NADPH:quinone reductase-like Zn-dependent oxidoreductase